MDATKDRLTRKLGAEPEIRALIDEILEGKREVQNNNLSLTQACEKAERRRILERMSNDEKLWVESNGGPGCAWVRTTLNVIDMGYEAKTVDRSSKKKVVRISITKKRKV